jgi:hypothetical protein
MCSFKINPFCLGTCSTQTRTPHTGCLKLNVVKYAKDHSNRTAERCFGPLATSRIIHEWRRQDEELQQLEN